MKPNLLKAGAFTENAAVMDGTALVGKASQIFRATLRKLAETAGPAKVKIGCG